MDDREDRSPLPDELASTLEAPQAHEEGARASDADEPAILDEVMIEEVGIDGMCGVY